MNQFDVVGVPITGVENLSPRLMRTGSFVEVRGRGGGGGGDGGRGLFWRSTVSN